MLFILYMEVFGSYAALEGGHTQLGLGLITGGFPKRVSLLKRRLKNRENEIKMKNNKSDQITIIKDMQNNSCYSD